MEIAAAAAVSRLQPLLQIDRAAVASRLQPLLQVDRTAAACRIQLLLLHLKILPRKYLITYLEMTHACSICNMATDWLQLLLLPPSSRHSQLPQVVDSVSYLAGSPWARANPA